jgi:hypothetical protein
MTSGMPVAPNCPAVSVTVTPASRADSRRVGPNTMSGAHAAAVSVASRTGVRLVGESDTGPVRLLRPPQSACELNVHRFVPELGGPGSGCAETKDE